MCLETVSTKKRRCIGTTCKKTLIKTGFDVALEYVVGIIMDDRWGKGDVGASIRGSSNPTTRKNLNVEEFLVGSA